MEVHGALDLLGNDLKQVTFSPELNFPTNPRPGRFLFKDKTLYFCLEIDQGLPVWVPLIKDLSMVKYIQDTPSMEWVISHGLNTNYVISQVFDTSGNTVIPDNVNSGTFNSVVISFATPTAGVAILQRGDLFGASPAIYAFSGDYTGSTWTVNHNLGYHPIVECIINAQVVQPVSISHASFNQAIINWSSIQTGSVRCI